MFYTVGMLRETLQNYPDDTPISVNDLPGLIITDEERKYINIVNLADGDSDDVIYQNQIPATMSQEYMDF